MKKILLLSGFVALIVYSCSKKNDIKGAYRLDADTLSMHYDQTHQFQVSQGSTLVTDSLTVWKSSNDTIGTIDKYGLFTAKKIGSVIVTGTAANYSLKSRITVVPYSILCTEPYFKAGATIDATKAAESRSLLNETGSALVYQGENNKVSFVEYAFNTDSMTAAQVIFANTIDAAQESVKFYSERYTSLGTANDIEYYTDNANVLIALSLDSKLGLNALYAKYTAHQSNDVKSGNLTVLNNLRLQALSQIKANAGNH